MVHPQSYPKIAVDHDVLATFEALLVKDGIRTSESVI
jgi:hypothetical protein